MPTVGKNRSRFSADVSRLEEHYSRLFMEHNDTPAAVQQRDRTTQESRMLRLCEVGDISEAAILDWGCGSGHLLHVLRTQLNFQGQYTGYDVSEPHLQAARLKFPDATFDRRDIFSKGAGGEFDYVLISGVFNNKINDNWEFMKEAISILFSATRKAIAFNALSYYVDYFDDHLFYVDPCKVFEFCKKNISPLVSLRHDYRLKPGTLPYEFTVYVRRG